MSGLTAPERERERHVGLVYPTMRVRDDAVVAFVETGLRLGEQVVLATGEHGWESVWPSTAWTPDGPPRTVR